MHWQPSTQWSPGPHWKQRGEGGDRPPLLAPVRPHLEGPQRQKDAELLERGQRRPRGAGRPGWLRCGASRELGVCGRGNDFKLNRAGSGEVLRRNFHLEGGEAEELWVPHP